MSKGEGRLSKMGPDLYLRHCVALFREAKAEERDAWHRAPGGSHDTKNADNLVNKRRGKLLMAALLWADAFDKSNGNEPRRY